MTDFTNDFEDSDDAIGTERMSYTRFHTAFVTRRPAQAPSHMVSWSKLQLPNNSVIHSVNGFETLTASDHGMPNPHLPVITNEAFPVWLSVQSKPSDANTKPFGTKEAYLYRSGAVATHIPHFFQSNRKLHRILSERTLGTMSGVLTWVDYSPLNEMKFSGTLAAYRKFDVMFRTILNMMVRIGEGVNQYLILPQSDHVFAKPLLQRTYRELSTSTLNPLLHDPSVFPVLHLLGYVFGKTNPLKVTPYKDDVKVLGKDAKELESLTSTSLFDRINPSALAFLNIVLVKDDNAVIYNLGELGEFAQDATFYNRFYRHIMNLRLMASGEVGSHIDVDSDDFDTLVNNIAGDTVIEDTPSAVKVVTPELPKGFLKIETPNSTRVEIVPTTKPDDMRLVKEGDDLRPQSFEEKVRTQSTQAAHVAAQVDVKVKTRQEQLIENHLNTTLGGKTIGELIRDPEQSDVSPRRLDFVTSSPEESYKISTLTSVDKAYQEHGYRHELAKVIASVAKHGYFATKIEEEKTHTEMDRTTTYKVSLTDLSGKAHHVKFTLPDVDSNGMMKLSGIEYRLTRQMTMLPIAKTAPTRVNLSSYYNKVIVERIESKRNSYEQDITKLVLHLKAQGLLDAVSGSSALPSQTVPYDYTAVGRSFTEISFQGYTLVFASNGMPLDQLNFDGQANIEKLTLKFGTLAGYTKTGDILFWDSINQIHCVSHKGDVVESWKSFHAMLLDVIGAEALVSKPTVEYTQVKLLDRKIPTVFILAYKLGLKTVLDMIRLDYRFYPSGTKAEVNTNDIAVKFSDGTLVFNRYPLSRSLIAAGLTWVKLNDVAFSELMVPETYGRVFQKKDMTVGVLKGINGFYDFFVDPITETVLEKMGEPTTFHELLLRANVMLTDYFSHEPSAIRLYRFRLYERFNGMVYNEMYRGLAAHRGNLSNKKSFSINPEAVFLRIVQDATVSPNDVINPVHEVKQRTNFTFTGSGGRTQRSFVQADLRYPEDGLGVISENVPDSGKVGITAYLSASPNISDIHGIPKPYEKGDELEPTQILSIGSMLMPGSTTDDGKRANYLSIQLSHYVPNTQDGETLAVRTGYDEVLPHITTDTFAVSAQDDGVVQEIDTKFNVIKVRYADKPYSILRSLKVPLTDAQLNSLRDQSGSFGFLIPDVEITDYPMGGVFSLTKTCNGKVIDRLRCETPEAIPDKDVARKQPNLVQDLVRGRYKALYYIRFAVVGLKIPGLVKSYSFSDIHTPISGAYLLQKRIPNVGIGDRFKAGDILIYNPGFFVPDPLSKQVTLKHGVIANIALIEKSSNHEDASEISRDLSERLGMTPCHQRSIVTKNDAAILSIVKVGDHVDAMESLCIISDDQIVGSSLSVNIENLDIMEKLSRQTPPADYTGSIRKIRILYGCEREQLSASLKLILKGYEKEVRDSFKALNSDPTIEPPEKPGWVAPGSRYQGITFDDTTVVLEFMIEENLGMAEGDKAVIGAQLKTIVSYVVEKPHQSESGIPIDMLFSTTGVTNRIVSSPISMGIAERVMGKLKDDVLDMYFQ